MNDDQNEMMSRRGQNLNELCLERQLLFNDYEEESEEEFGAEVIETERVILTERSTRLIRGSHTFRKLWDGVSVLLALYSCVVIPFVVAFYDVFSTVYIIVDTLVDCFFVADMLMNFYTTYLGKKGDEVMDKKKIMKNYLKRRFLVDIFCTFPIDKLLMIYAKKFLWEINMFSLLKILRLRRISVLSKSRELIRFRLLQVLVNLVLIIHFTACIWYIIVKRSETWIPFQDIGKGYTQLYTENVWGQFFTCYYEGFWLIFGQEVNPSNNLEIWIASVTIALGTITTSYLFGEILMIALRLGLKYDIRKQALDNSLSVMNKLTVSEALRQKVLNFVTQTYPTLSSQAEFERLCHYISPVLQKKVFEHIYKPIITKNFLFDGDNKLSEFIINRLRYNFYQPEQDIIVEGTRAADFYFLVKGLCSVFVKSREGKKYQVCHLGEGAHFGEVGLLYKTYRTATVMSRQYSTAAHLGKNEFKILTNAFPYVIDKMKCAILDYKDPWKTFVLSIFHQVDIFENLPIDLLNEMIYKMRVIKLQKGESLFRSGDVMKGMYAITNGALELKFLLNSDAKVKLTRAISFESNRDTENQEGEKVIMNISVSNGQKIKAEIVPVLTEETDGDPKRISAESHEEIDIAILKQGTLLYPYMSLKKDFIHKFDCKALENSAVYLFDKETIRYLEKEYPDFKKSISAKLEDNYLDFWNAEAQGHYLRFLWKKAIVMVILKNRQIKASQKDNFKNMLNKIRSIIACQHANNHKLAEDVMQGVISHKFITKEGELDSAILYNGSLPSSHPIIKTFEGLLGANSTNSIIKQCNSLETELASQIPRIQACKQRISNSIGLVTTFLEQIKNK